MNNYKKFIINSSIKCPCTECTKRKLGCHSKCNEYAEYKKKLDNEVKNVRKQRTGGW